MSLRLQHSMQPPVKDMGKKGRKNRGGETAWASHRSCDYPQRRGAATQKITASLCKSNSTWKWSTKISSRSCGANRSTPGKALQAWIHSRGGEFTEESLETLHALQEAWLAEQLGRLHPKAKRRRRSAPPLSALHK